MSDYQQRLTDARRTALWRALEARRHAAERPASGKRQDQVAFSAVVVLVALLLGLVAGAAVAVWEAVWRFGG